MSAAPTPLIQVVHYADPWCWYCWGLEPVLRRLKEVYGDEIELVYKMGGMFNDMSEWMAENGVDSMEALESWVKDSDKQMGNPFNVRFVTNLKPASTWPACVAVKAAESQGRELGEEFYRGLMEAVQIFGKDGSDQAVQTRVAQDVGLDPEKFQSDLGHPRSQQRFLSDKDEMTREKGHFYALRIINTKTSRSKMVSGYQAEPYERAIDILSGGKLWKKTPIDLVEYLERRRGGLVGTREISTVFSIEESDAARRLDGLSKGNVVQKREVSGVGSYWSVGTHASPETLTLEQVELAHVTSPYRVTRRADLDSLVKPAVQRLYTEVSERPNKEFHFPIGRKAAILVGYSKADLDTIPQTAVESFAGVGYPFASEVIKKGDTILDVGSGSGTDILVAAHKTGPKGDVYGLDFTDAMIKKAESNISHSGLRNVKILKGEATKIPLPDESVDVVTSNGVLNLVPNKQKAFQEIYRVLKPGGRIQISDIIVDRDVQSACGLVPQLWADCIGGAAVEKDYLAMIKKAGFSRTRRVRSFDYFAESASDAVKRLARTFGARSVVITAAKKTS
ncbi:MAG TPA: methyltransferase domain-containing protein [Candidatus Bathyarchaeia archaeon]